MLSDRETLEIEELRAELKKAPPFLSIKDSARLLGISYWTLYKLVVVGHISATKVAGIWRIPRSALLAYLESRSPLNMDDGL